MLVTFDQVLTALRKYKGQFSQTYRDDGSTTRCYLRHDTEQNPDRSHCCPLAFLARTWGFEPHSNRDFIKFERALGLDPDTIARVVRAADGPSSSDRDKLLEACL